MRSQWVDKATGKVINLSNFSFSEMSGWNGYATDFIEKPWRALTSASYQADLVTIEPLRLKFKGILTDGHISCGISISNANIPEKAITYRLRVKGIKGNQIVRLRNESVSPIAETLLREDGVIEMDISKGSTSGSLYLYMITSGAANPDVDITIEQLPLYPGALVSDGVDDYGRTAEVIDEQVGTMLVYGDYLTTNLQYLLSCGLGTEETWLYATQEDNNGVARIGRPDKTVTDTMPMASLTRDQASPNAQMRLFNAGDRNYACAWLSRLILIREQLDDAAVEFLKWKVDKEHRDWLKEKGWAA